MTGSRAARAGAGAAGWLICAGTLAGCSTGSSSAPAGSVSAATTAGATPSPFASTATTSSSATADDGSVPSAAVEALRQAVHELTDGPAPAPARSTLVGYRVQDWTSADDFTLLVDLSLHFASTDTAAWSEGANERFVHFTRSSGQGGYRLSWASSP